MLSIALQIIFSGSIVVAVSRLAGHAPKIGGLILSLPIVSIVAFVASWLRTHNPTSISEVAKEMLIMVPLTLVFYVPLLFVNSNFSFWWALLLGILLSLLALGICFWIRA